MVAKQEPIPLEQLRVLDMFLMFPMLLHRLSLPADIKARFRQLNIPAPTDCFIRIPSTASAWQDLQIYQATALKRLTGLGLLKRDCLRDRNASLVVEMLPNEIMKQVIAQNEIETSLMLFLIDDVSSLPMAGANGLLKRAGLPSRGPVL